MKRKNLGRFVHLAPCTDKYLAGYSNDWKEKIAEWFERIDVVNCKQIQGEGNIFEEILFVCQLA